jgi:hypothetical protein
MTDVRPSAVSDLARQRRSAVVAPLATGAWPLAAVGSKRGRHGDDRKDDAARAQRQRQRDRVAFLPETDRHKREYSVLLEGDRVADLGGSDVMGFVCTTHRAVFTGAKMFGGVWDALVCPTCNDESKQACAAGRKGAKPAVIIIMEDLRRVTDRWNELAPNWRDVGDVANRVLDWVPNDVDAPVLPAAALLEHVEAASRAGSGQTPGMRSASGSSGATAGESTGGPSAAKRAPRGGPGARSLARSHAV